MTMWSENVLIVGLICIDVLFSAASDLKSYSLRIDEIDSKKANTLARVKSSPPVLASAKPSKSMNAVKWGSNPIDRLVSKRHLRTIKILRQRMIGPCGIYPAMYHRALDDSFQFFSQLNRCADVSPRCGLTRSHIFQHGHPHCERRSSPGVCSPKPAELEPIGAIPRSLPRLRCR